MPIGKVNQDTETLEMALIGFEQKKVEIEGKILHIKTLLAGGSVSSLQKSAAPKNAAPVRKRRPLSKAARNRIALAQKKRWAEHNKNKLAAAQ